MNNLYDGQNPHHKPRNLFDIPNKKTKKLKWYHYAAKVVMLAISIPVTPIFVVMFLSMGEHPFTVQMEIWKRGK